ncbi:MAG: fimbrillin family protein, partial [Rikenellaceae bacterium]
MMKKLLGILTFFAVFILGCSDSTEIDNEKVDQPIIEPPVNVVNFGGGVEETKATMQNDYSFKWDVNDNISIFGETANVLYAANKNYKVTTAAVESSFAPAAGETISWNGSVEHTFYAYYPYNNVSSNPKVVTIPTMNIEQNGANS